MRSLTSASMRSAHYGEIRVSQRLLSEMNLIWNDARCGLGSLFSLAAQILRTVLRDTPNSANGRFQAIISWQVGGAGRILAPRAMGDALLGRGRC